MICWVTFPLPSGNFPSGVIGVSVLGRTGIQIGPSVVPMAGG
jgi:hypothetical protein